MSPDHLVAVVDLLKSIDVLTALLLVVSVFVGVGGCCYLKENH